MFLAVHLILQCLARLESRYGRGSDLNSLAGARIAGGTRRTLALFKGAETEELHLVTGGDRVTDAVQHRIQNICCLLLGQLIRFCDLLY